MRNEILFMPLGGGQRVGASCYYLRLGNNNIILDAGTGTKKGLKFSPVFSGLFDTPDFYSINQINQIFISHAHLDHVGYLFNLMSNADRADVYMTDITKSLASLQIYDRIFFSDDADEMERLRAQTHLDRITTVSYLKEMKFSDYSVTFYPAGHIPGAMMMLFRYKKRRILYTGDYSITPSPLTSGCYIPDGEKPDTVILCGLHAKHPDYRKNNDSIYRRIEHIFRTVGGGLSVQCSVSQLSKGVEFLKMLNDRNVLNIPIFIDGNIMEVVRKMEKNGIKIISETNRQMVGRVPQSPHIYLTSDSYCDIYRYKKYEINFTLHEDFSEMKDFIKKINPKQVVVVHCSEPHDSDDYTIEQTLLMDGCCNSQFIFAEEQELYLL